VNMSGFYNCINLVRVCSPTTDVLNGYCPFHHPHIVPFITLCTGIPRVGTHACNFHEWVYRGLQQVGFDAQASKELVIPPKYNAKPLKFDNINSYQYI